MFKKILANIAGGALMATACPSVNKDFDYVLEGRQAPTDQIVYNMWGRFVQQCDSVVPTSGRFETFKENVIKVAKHNRNDSKTFTMEVNKLSAMTFDEVKEYYNMNAE